MTDKILKATHWGDVTIGKVKLPSAVLENGTRVLSERGITHAMLGSRSGGSKRAKRKGGGAPMPLFLAPANLKLFLTEDCRLGPDAHPILGRFANLQRL